MKNAPSALRACIRNKSIGSPNNEGIRVQAEFRYYIRQDAKRRRGMASGRCVLWPAPKFWVRSVREQSEIQWEAGQPIRYKVRQSLHFENTYTVQTLAIKQSQQIYGVFLLLSHFQILKNISGLFEKYCYFVNVGCYIYILISKV